MCSPKTLLKIGAVVAAAGIAGFVLFPQARPLVLGLAPYALFALCPLAMLIGMRGGRTVDDRRECAMGRGPESAVKKGTLPR